MSQSNYLSDMNTLDLILARTNLSLTIEKLRSSLNDVKTKHANKSSLIESMEKSLSDLTFTYVFFCELEAEFRTARQRNGGLETLNLKLSIELEELKKKNEELKLNLNI